MRVRHTGRTSFGAYLRHQREFGKARGALGIHLNLRQMRIGRHPIMILPVGLKRLTYILKRILQWNRRRLVPTVALLPLITAGLIAWAIGFRRGLLESQVG